MKQQINNFIKLLPEGLSRGRDGASSSANLLWPSFRPVTSGSTKGRIKVNQGESSPLKPRTFSFSRFPNLFVSFVDPGHADPIQSNRA
jgi:hypothetical protein